MPKSERTVDRWFNVDAGFLRTTAQGSLASNIRMFPMRFAGVQADGQSKWDLSLTKSFRIRERSQVRFRAQCFNIMNHANFAAPNLGPTGSSFGRVTATQGMPRTIQLSTNLSF